MIKKSYYTQLFIQIVNIFKRGDFLQEKWYILDTGYHDAATNMAIDEALLQFHAEGIIQPTLRFYGWKNPSLTLGHFQKAEKAIDFDAVKKHGCDFVRRLTGGSAVLHDDEITYSIIVSEEHPKIPSSINEAYYVLSKGLLEGYQLLGVNAEFAVPEEEAKRQRSDVCFEQPAIYEMLVDGKKISGNAQTRKNGVLLQHGSIPMSFDLDMLFDLFNYPNKKVKERQKQAFKHKATSINDITGKTHTYEMMRDAFLQGFEHALNIQTETFQLNEDQWKYVEHLVETKYRTDEWNFKLKKSMRSI